MAISSQELRSHLDEQMLILTDAAERYDAGFHPAFKQLAVSLRVLVHDTQQSTSLLEHIGVKLTMQWLAAARIVPGNLLNEFPLASIEMRSEGEGLTYVRYKPHDSERCAQFGTLLDFKAWWNDPVIRLANRDLHFTRRNLVLYVANKSGGAHIDAIPPVLRDIEENNALGLEIGGTEGESVPLKLSPIPATIRTIVEEVRLSVLNQASAIKAALGE